MLCYESVACTCVCVRVRMAGLFEQGCKSCLLSWLIVNTTDSQLVMMKNFNHLDFGFLMSIHLIGYYSLKCLLLPMDVGQFEKR